MSALLEVACFSREDALHAAEGGANRIELCRNYDVGGLTPSTEDFAFVRQRVEVPVFVMIRVHANGFTYTDAEVDQMVRNAEMMVAGGADGIVFGALTTNGNIDENAVRRIVEAAHPRPVTFHRAFDEATDPLEALETLMRCGVARVLSSGGQPTAMEGAKLLAQLVERAKSDLNVIPGGGVRSHNVADLLERTRAAEVHSAARTQEARVDPKEVRRLLEALA